MINFENGKTPINDANLNKLQTNLIGTVLFENPAGITNGTHLMLDDVSNYKRFKIVYGCINANERKIYEGKVVDSIYAHLQSEVINKDLRIYMLRYLDLIMGGDLFNIQDNSYVNINHNASPYVGNPNTADNYIAIYKIIGYKEE